MRPQNPEKGLNIMRRVYCRRAAVSCLQVAGGLVVTGGFDGQCDSTAIQAVAASTDELDERSDVKVVSPNADREIEEAEQRDDEIDFGSYDVSKERSAEEAIDVLRKLRYYSGSPERFDWLADEEEEIAKYAEKYANVVSDDYYLPVQEREFPLEEKVEYIDDVLLNGNLMDGEQAESLVDNDLKENHPFYRFREELAVAGGVVEIEKDLADLDQEEWRNQRQREMKERLGALRPIVFGFRSLREERLNTLFADLHDKRMTHSEWLKQYHELKRRSPGELLAIKRVKVLERRLKAMNKSKNDNFCIAPDVPAVERLPNWEPSQKLAIINLWGWEEGRRPLSRSKNHRRKCCGRRGHKQGSWVNRLACIDQIARVYRDDGRANSGVTFERSVQASAKEAIDQIAALERFKELTAWVRDRDFTVPTRVLERLRSEHSEEDSSICECTPNCLYDAYRLPHTPEALDVLILLVKQEGGLVIEVDGEVAELRIIAA